MNREKEPLTHHIKGLAELAAQEGMRIPTGAASKEEGRRDRGRSRHSRSRQHEGGVPDVPAPKLPFEGIPLAPTPLTRVAVESAVKAGVFTLVCGGALALGVKLLLPIRVQHQPSAES